MIELFFDYSIWLLLGIIAGFMAGILPGHGLTTSVLIFYPMLIGSPDYLSVLIFYISMFSISQYLGSVTSTILGIPGEASSLPAVTEGHQLFKNGKGDIAISNAALGSFFGSMIAIFLVYFLVENFIFVYSYYDTVIQSVIFVFVLVLLLVTTNRKWYISLILMILGYILGRIGNSQVTYGDSFLTFGNPDLTTGLPLFPVLIALFAVPEILKPVKKYAMNDNSKQILKIKDHFLIFFKNKGSVLRGTIIGFFAGLVPGLAHILSANLSYSIEKAFRKIKGIYKEDGDLGSLVSSETANNTGAFSALLPLIILGIPITASEALIYDIIASKGVLLGSQHFNLDFFMIILIFLIITNFIGVLLAWPMVKYIKYLFLINLNYIRILIFVVLTIMIYIIGNQFWQGPYYITVFFALLPLGVLLRNYNTMPLIFVFILQSNIEEVLIRLPQLLF